MIGLIDYGAGNMRSVANALAHLELPFAVCATGDDVRRADRIILPGVGHFLPASQSLLTTGMHQAIVEMAAAGTPVLGICLGMQLFFAASAEAPGALGLNLLAGEVVRLQAARVPHMGWNGVLFTRTTALAERGAEHYFYFAHSFVAKLDAADDAAGLTVVDEAQLAAAVCRDNILGVQFHPEKSGPAGLALLRSFARC